MIRLSEYDLNTLIRISGLEEKEEISKIEKEGVVSEYKKWNGLVHTGNKYDGFIMEKVESILDSIVTS